MTKTFNVKRIDDRSLFDILKAAKIAGEETLGKLQEQGIPFGSKNHEIELHFDSGLPWEISEDDLEGAPAGQFILSHAVLNFTYSIRSPNRNENYTASFRIERSGTDSLVDLFTLTHSKPGSQDTGEGEEEVLRSIHKVVSRILQPVAPEDGGLIATLSNLNTSFATTYQRISDELSIAVKKVGEERSAQVQEFQKERKKLLGEIAAERKQMRERTETELSLERAKLDEGWSEIETAKANLEISSHKDARRKQFSSLQDDLKKALTEPIADKELRSMRFLVFAALMAAGLVTAILAGERIAAGAEIKNLAADTSTLVIAVQTFFLSFASLSAFIGGAAWLRYFYVKDMQTLNEMRQFRNDLARASWVMDAALEIRKEHNEEIPPEWLKGVTEGLFSAKGAASMDEGAQALAALMGLSASASVGPSGTSFELGRKGTKAFAAAAKRNDPT